MRVADENPRRESTLVLEPVRVFDELDFDGDGELNMRDLRRALVRLDVAHEFGIGARSERGSANPGETKVGRCRRSRGHRSYSGKLDASPSRGLREPPRRRWRTHVGGREQGAAGRERSSVRCLLRPIGVATEQRYVLTCYVTVIMCVMQQPWVNRVHTRRSVF